MSDPSIPHVLVALTFDAGPDGVPAGKVGKRYNSTEHILTALANPGRLDSRLAGAEIRAGFFVQTHVPGRMADAEGKLGTGTNLTKGQQLVRRMIAEGHLVGVLNGSAVDLETHLEQVHGDVPTLENNLRRAVEALKPLLSAEAGKQQSVEFVRSPFGMHDAACDEVYRKVFPDASTEKASLHRLWDTQAGPHPPGDLCLGSSVKTLCEQLRGTVRGVAKTLARMKDKPKFLPVVLQLHDLSPGTAAHFPRLVEAVLDGGVVNNQTKVPVRFCSSLAEVSGCLRQVTHPSTHEQLAKNARKHPYGPHLRMTRTLKSLEDTLQYFFLLPHEWWVNHLYLDHKGYVTAGVGCRVWLTGLAKEPGLISNLPLKKGKFPSEGDEDATEAEKKKAYDTLVASLPKAPKPLSLRLEYCAMHSEAHLLDDGTLTLLEDKIARARSELEAGFGKDGKDLVAALPPPARLALTDMVFNLGKAGLFGGKKKRGYPRLLKAVRASVGGSDSWVTAADECERDVQPERNEATRDLFLAAGLLTQSTW